MQMTIMERFISMNNTVGTDIVEISRIEESIHRFGQHFLDRLFNQHEQEYCLRCQQSAPHVAGMFSAKEAVSKALGTGFGKELSWHDIIISHDEKGAPLITLSEEKQKHFGYPNIQVSISHCKAYATAVAIVFAS